MYALLRLHSNNFQFGRCYLDVQITKPGHITPGTKICIFNNVGSSIYSRNNFENSFLQLKLILTIHGDDNPMK